MRRRPGAFFAGDWRRAFYFVVQLVGAAGLTLLLAALLWPSRRKRNPTLVSLCVSWWISSLPCLLLLYYAGDVAGPPPPQNICLASAVLTMAQTPMVTLSAPCVVFHVWVIIRNTMRTSSLGPVCSPLITWTLVAVPYITFAACAFSVLGIGMDDPTRVHRVVFYCVVDSSSYTTATSVLGILPLALATVCAVWILVLLRRNRTHMVQKGVDVSLVLRVVVFGLYILTGLGLEIASIFNWTFVGPDLFFATCGLAVFVVFGTQRSVWRVWVPARHSQGQGTLGTAAGGTAAAASAAARTRTRAGAVVLSLTHISFLSVDPVVSLSYADIEGAAAAVHGAGCAGAGVGAHDEKGVAHSISDPSASASDSDSDAAPSSGSSARAPAVTHASSPAAGTPGPARVRM